MNMEYIFGIVLIMCSSCTKHEPINEVTFSLLDHCEVAEGEGFLFGIKNATFAHIIEIGTQDVLVPIKSLHPSDVVSVRFDRNRNLIEPNTFGVGLVLFLVKKNNPLYSRLEKSENNRKEVHYNPDLFLELSAGVEKYGFYRSSGNENTCEEIPALLEGKKYLVVGRGSQIISIEPYFDQQDPWVKFVLNR